MVSRQRSAFEPAYLRLYESGELTGRVGRGLELLADCTVCPRDCHVDRLQDKYAVCKTGRYAVVSSHFAHLGEENCLRGWNGSGTIFFSWCNLRCVFCQNYDISWQGGGRATPPDQLARMMLSLQERGCHRRARHPAGPTGPDDAEPAGARLPQHQLCYPRARGAADSGGAPPGD
jgi:putative pyruvate formate lyase activating enzyme